MEDCLHFAAHSLIAEQAQCVRIWQAGSAKDGTDGDALRASGALLGGRAGIGGTGFRVFLFLMPARGWRSSMTFPKGNRWTKLYLYGITLLVCIGFADTSHSQSDDTCISYMEIMAEYRQDVKTIEEKHRPIQREANAQLNKAEEERNNCSRRAWKDKGNCLEKRDRALKDLKETLGCNDWEKVRERYGSSSGNCELDAANKANEMYRCYEKGRKESAACHDRFEDAFTKLKNIKSAKLLPIRQKLKNAKRIRDSKLRRVYDGPGSDNEEVLWRLIEHDLELCHNDGFRMF